MTANQEPMVKTVAKEIQEKLVLLDNLDHKEMLVPEVQWEPKEKLDQREKMVCLFPNY